MNRTGLASLIVLALVGCGSPRPTPNLIVIGNSITYSGPSPIVDWNGNWGMAASAQDKDFAHVAGSALGLPVSVFPMVTLERLQTAYLEGVNRVATSVTHESIVVVELGDNAINSDPAAFDSAYRYLLENVSRRKRLICVSTFWAKSDLDARIRAACEYHEGTYVYIGDIRTNPANTDWRVVEFSNAAVQSHPHDWSAASRRTASSDSSATT